MLKLPQVVKLRDQFIFQNKITTIYLNVDTCLVFQFIITKFATHLNNYSRQGFFKNKQTNKRRIGIQLIWTGRDAVCEFYSLPPPKMGAIPWISIGAGRGQRHLHPSYITVNRNRLQSFTSGGASGRAANICPLASCVNTALLRMHRAAAASLYLTNWTKQLALLKKNTRKMRISLQKEME